MKSLGRYFLFLGTLFVNKEPLKVYAKQSLEEAVRIGVNSVLIVIVISVFMGAVTTIQTAHNLVSPLVPSYILSTIVRDMAIIELAPTITAIIFAGRVGSSIAGQLGTMKITEQIDAIEVMGINAASYLVLPKIIATLFTYPLLVVIASFVAIYSGYLVGTWTQIITPQEYIYGISTGFDTYNITFALSKSLVFAFLVSSICAHKGFSTRGGALELGKATTSAVTQSCVAILLADYLLAQLFL